jgi:3-oxoacyl-[acyl-carrier protein] reductase
MPSALRVTSKNFSLVRYNGNVKRYEYGENGMNFNGKVALITGGARGIGRAIGERFASSGATVIVADLNIDQAQSTARDLQEKYGHPTIAIQVNVSDYENARQMVEQVIQAFGKIDILVNNAGITRDTLILRMEEKDWDLVIDVNLKGAFNCSKAVVRSMIKQRSGRIVNISSVSGLAGQSGQTNYSASKAGVIGFTKALAREVASRNITVNAVAPGFIPTALTVDLPDDLKESIIKATPMGRMGNPEEVASAVAFFASDDASYITGQVLSVDGGMVMM